jgi:uncharacterized membrane protein YdbT with pleckstrin-like domain
MQQLHPKAVWLFFINSVMKFFFIFLWFFVALVASLTSFVPPSQHALIFASILLFLGFVLGFSYLWARWAYKFYRFELASEGFKKEYGVISKKYVTIPYERIQNVDIHRTLLDRALGLSHLRIQTAGASGVVTSEGTLPGLGHENALRISSELIARAKNPTDLGL